MSLDQLRDALLGDQPDAALRPALAALAAPAAAGESPDGSALAVGGVLAEAWIDFRIGAVIRLLELLTKEGVDEAAMKAVRKPLGEEFKLAQAWTKRLGSIARQAQLAALRDAVRTKRAKDAVALAEQIARDEDPAAALPLIGSILGSVETDLPAVRQLAQVIGARLALDPDQLRLIHDAIDRRVRSLYEGAPENREREFRGEMTAATIELAKALPDATATTKEAEEAGAMAFAARVRAVLAAAIRWPERDYWPIAARLLVEFLPREGSAASKMSGVEERQFQSLSPKARRAVTRAFREIGRHAPVVAPLVEKATAWLAAEAPEATAGVELLGALRHPLAMPLLLRLLAPKTDPALQAIAVDGLGRLGNDKAVEALFGYLKGIVAARTLDARGRRLATHAIVALGRVARNPKIDDQMRAQVMMMVRQALPVEDHGLQARAVTELVSPKMLEKIDPTFRRWAARILTEQLWTPDQQASFARLEEGARPSQLGARQGAVELLEVLAQHELSAVIEAAEPRATRFSGAMMALGEVFAKVPAPEELRLLDMMITAAAHHVAGRQNDYAQEQMWDVENETYVALDREPVLESLAFAVVRNVEAEAARGRPGEAVSYLEELFARVRSGDLPTFGEKATRLLFDAYQKHVEGRKAAARGAAGGAPGPGAFTPTPETAQGTAAHDSGAYEQTRAMAREEEPAAPAARGGAGGGGAGGDGRAALTIEQKVALLKQLRKGGLFAASRRQNKVVAMQQLAGAGDLDALPVILEHLEDKDMLVATAAGTALIEYTRATQPARTSELAVGEMIDALTTGKLTFQRALRKAMSQMNLLREPCRRALERKLREGGGMGLAYELSQVLGLASPEEAYQRIVGRAAPGTGGPGGEVAPAGSRGAVGAAAAATAPSPGAAGDDAAAGSGAPAGGRAAGGAGELERKRALLEARRAWIAGGKKGPEPR